MRKLFTALSVRLRTRGDLDSDPRLMNSQQELILDPFPNPANNFINLPLISNDIKEVEWELKNELGQSIMEETIPVSAEIIRLDLSKLPEGIYFYNLTYAHLSQSGKIILIK